ncbi:MAG: prephenate dehydratase [Alphaproteobacteria bacterium]|nr:prephenate dehydratase [Alphaproteobacteria bacterium]
MTTRPHPNPNVIAFQGEPGSYAHIACREVFPELDPAPFQTFEDTFVAVSESRARLAMIPVENSLYGRITDIHHLLPESGLFIVGEHFLRIHHQLLGVKGARIEGLKTVMSQPPALGQCRRIIRELGLTAIAGTDTARSAKHIADAGDPTAAAIASSLAAEVYGLDILRKNVEDAEHNTTRFLIMSGEPAHIGQGAPGTTVTSFIFRVRNVPAALYKAMGGFATNGVNMTKLESYQLGGAFTATQFYADIHGHPEDHNVRLALEELQFFSTHLRILGVYQGHAYRESAHALAD